jgi:hypothetical protein
MKTTLCLIILIFGNTTVVASNVNSVPDIRSNSSSSVPDIRSNNTSVPDIRKNSATGNGNNRNLNELGNISESTDRAAQPPPGNPLKNINRINAEESRISTLSGTSCRTYEGREFSQGEAGYNDCIRKIKSDKQGTTTVP